MDDYSQVGHAVGIGLRELAAGNYNWVTEMYDNLNREQQAEYNLPSLSRMVHVLYIMSVKAPDMIGTLKIHGIKTVMSTYHVGLKEAKALVEILYNFDEDGRVAKICHPSWQKIAAIL